MLQWSFSSQGSLTFTTITDAAKWLATYDDMMCQELSQNSNLTAEQAKQMAQRGTSVTAQEALQMNLIHAVETPQLPTNARSWQV